MSRLRVAVVGTGFIAGRHLTALSSMPDVDIVAVADESAERATTAADKVGARPYQDGVEMMATEDLDAVWLCVPPFAHGLLEQAALDRSLPFFVEKPLSTDMAVAQQVSDAVRTQGLRTAVGYHWRYLDVVEQARAQLRDRAPQLLVGQWLDATPAAPWWSTRATSGGQLVEQTTHLFDLARLFCGEVDTVVAAESTLEREQWPDADVPTVSTVMLRFATGALGTISSSCLLEGRHRVGLRLVAPGRVLSLRERALSDHELSVDDHLVARSDQDPIATEDRAFVRALLGQEDDVRAPYDEALRTHALVCAADRSARTGAPVHLGGTGV
ncbi:MAG: gfo/Idh/MocA family oxidoreductase [Marmoricola sp.]|nr:gfo/Idh/MocA family oxidoreductase [Marmoricola sp.]